MPINDPLAEEIRTLCKSDRFKLRSLAFEICEALDHRYQFDATVGKYGHAKVAVCLANTVLKNRNDHDNDAIQWASEIMKNVPNDCLMRDAYTNLHPALLADSIAILMEGATKPTHIKLSSQQQKTLRHIASKPTPNNVQYKDAVALLNAVGTETTHSRGSHVSFRKAISDGQTTTTYRVDLHKPHPGKELKKYQVDELINFFTQIGVLP
jgi:predicted RNA binding protein YcfA (HicA-like mRNA interferase family)